ncbi:hypothetical protein POY32_27605 [Klebsiella michiganensis]|uniref:Uncharacterized protein n=3 Tax=Klebsiella/Raoultella group TaxID=2890311 RepID=A0AAX3CUT9_9ENTR|nr:hypothetical protein [Klebsiella michiganensis]UWZ75598.1 hypothetical protein NP224_07830 [Klebsiella michiganensis]SYO03839.1 Uncharacterised protein [Klebsiella pneumoniae]HBY5418639.1 hypothetical protein [Klebsiella pneumoniae]
MGCDIHMMVELKRSVNDKEIWVNYDHFRKNPYFGEFDDEDEYVRIELNSLRSYVAFSQLCGVRAYSKDTPMISEPRGIPDDASEYTKRVSSEYGLDGHSHSYVTLAEIRDFRANLKPMPFKGMISTEQAADLDKGITPDTWCGWTSAAGYVHREWIEVVDGLKEIGEALESRALEFWPNKKYVNPENIRIVFFFDN